jgi:nucleoside phosphorylase
METTCYTVGWMAPLPLEHTAAISTLEEVHGEIPANGYCYHGGRIGAHNIVIGVQSRMGTDAASDLAARMEAAFPNIKFFLVIGIGGGVPRYGPPGAISKIVLGDVVVSYLRGSFGGVVRYDFGAWEGEDESHLSIGGHVNGPPDALLGAVNRLRGNHDSVRGTKIPNLLQSMRLKIREDERHKYQDQGPDQDMLFQDSFPHPIESQDTHCWQCCDPNFLQQRHVRGASAIRRTDIPMIHYGNIGSSNQLQISTAMRNKLQKDYNVICFEMEGAGVIQKHPCLIVRGICDYSDSHKNKTWQPYAAATAAAYTRELLESMPAASFGRNQSTYEWNKFQTCLRLYDNILATERKFDDLKYFDIEFQFLKLETEGIQAVLREKASLGQLTFGPVLEMVFDGIKLVLQDIQRLFVEHYETKPEAGDEIVVKKPTFLKAATGRTVSASKDPSIESSRLSYNKERLDALLRRLKSMTGNLRSVLSSTEQKAADFRLRSAALATEDPMKLRQIAKYRFEGLEEAAELKYQNIVANKP